MAASLVASTQLYPELEAIPSAPPRSTAASTGSSASQLFPVPSWAVRLFSAFPLHVWPEAEVISPTPSPPPVKPTLYVAPHLNRDGKLADPRRTAGDGQRSPGWTSSDPVCLRWQMELLFRGVDFEVEFLDPSQSWGPGRQLPFLHLPPAFQPLSGGAYTSKPASWLGAKGGATVPSLLTPAALPHFLDNHFPYSRPELGETAETNPVWKDWATELESRSWVNLASGRIMAGVMLAVLLSPASAMTLQSQDQPYLSSLFASQLQATFLDDQLRRISALNPKGRSQPTSYLPGWEVGLLGWVGARSTGAGAASDMASSDDDDGLRHADPAVDEERVLDDAVRGLEALGVRTQIELEGGATWILDANRPTQLDAVVFAVVHTVMSLAATPAFAKETAGASSNKQALLRLKAVLEGKPWLINWSRRVWKQMLRDKERR
ncbi:hypothetical protein ACQY0O_007329 [Thecaphora frezii]